MKGPEYEEYVAEVVRQLKFCRNAKVSRNRKFPGKRQPGQYEIDIAVEITFSEAIYFLLVVECKDWKRPVDRPVVQKLAQTRDAVAAHKAVIVSPVGFSDEAVNVAKVLGIALWIICPGQITPIVVCARRVTPSAADRLFDALRIGFLNAVGTTPSAPPLDIRLRCFEEAELKNKKPWLFYYFARRPWRFDRFIRTYIDEPIFSMTEPLPIFDPILKEVFDVITSVPQWYEIEALNNLKNWFIQSKQELIKFGLTEPEIQPALLGIAGNEWWKFSEFRYRKSPSEIDLPNID